MSKKAAKKAKVKTTKSSAKKTSRKPAPAKKAKKSAVKKAKAPAKKAVTKAPVKKTVKKTVIKKEVKKPQHSPLLASIIDGLEEKKAKNITVMDLNRISGRSFDYFVIADADSKTHVESIAGSVEEEVKKKTSERPFHTEGWQNGEWILLDYVNIIVHVFQRPVREFYNLEGLWADATVQKIN